MRSFLGRVNGQWTKKLTFCALVSVGVSFSKYTRNLLFYFLFVFAVKLSPLDTKCAFTLSTHQTMERNDEKYSVDTSKTASFHAGVGLEQEGHKADKQKIKKHKKHKKQKKRTRETKEDVSPVPESESGTVEHKKVLAKRKLERSLDSTELQPLKKSRFTPKNSLKDMDACKLNTTKITTKPNAARTPRAQKARDIKPKDAATLQIGCVPFPIGLYDVSNLLPQLPTPEGRYSARQGILCIKCSSVMGIEIPQE
jgi:hypothetical protein